MGVITTSPKNAIRLVGDKTILECAADNAVTWHHDNVGITGSGCSSNTYATTPDSNATHCSVIVQGNDSTKLSGVYICNDGTFSAQAVVTIAGQYVIFFYSRCYSVATIYSVRNPSPKHVKKLDE